jgi:DNA-binding transcriptional MerR regulator
MPDETLYTLRQLAEELKLPESTLRYYRDAFVDHIPSVGTGRRRRYPREAVAVLRTIAKSYSAGRSRAEIVAAIGGHQPAAAAAPVHAFSSDKTSQAMPLEEVTNLDLLAAIVDGEREQRDALWQMAKEIVRLADVLDGQDAVLTEIAGRAGVVVTPSLARGASPVATLGTPAAPADARPAVPASAPADPRPAAPPPDARPIFGHAAPAEPVTAAAPATPVAEPAVPVAFAATESPAVADAPAPEPRLSIERSPMTFLSHDMDQLRAELEAERALVERLREAKLKLEHRTADAEAALEEQRPKRSGVIRRMLGSD